MTDYAVPAGTAIGHVHLKVSDLERSLAFYKNRYADASDFTFVFVGRFEPDALKPLVENPAAEWKHAAFSQVTRGANVGTFADAPKKRGGQIMGRSVRTERWRYTEWDGGRKGAELYDHDNDPAEMKNLANDPASAETLAMMKKLLHRAGR